MIELDSPLLIEYIEPGTDTKNRQIIKLWHGRLNHPALTCTPALIAAIGKDPATLPPGKTPVAALAHWKYSENKKKTGNPYHNVTHLEPLAPSPAASDPEARAEIIQRLDRIETMIRHIAARLPPAAEGTSFDYFYQDGSLATLPDEKTAFNEYRRANAEKVPANVDALREWVKAKKRTTGRPIPAPAL